MYLLAHAMLAVGIAVMSPASVAPRATGETLEPSGLTNAVRASDVAEIYIISPGIQFPTAPRPEMVREAGCKYLVSRESPQWRDLEHALGEADVRTLPTTRRAEVRLGLVLSDWRGMVREIYSDNMVQANGRTNGLDQRRQVEISGSFVTTLESFVARHPDLLLPSGASAHCPPGRLDDSAAGELIDALRGSDVADILVIRGGVELSRPFELETVRASSCIYRIRRTSAAWGDFERYLIEANFRTVPTSLTGEARIGLVLSSPHGVVRQIYMDDRLRPGGWIGGFDQRRAVEIPASFATALQRFVTDHPDLANSMGREGCRRVTPQ